MKLRNCAAMTLLLSVMAQAQGQKETKPTEDQVKALEKAVAHCVDLVHRSGDVNDRIMMEYYKKFDAYYNRTSGRVENNVQTVGDQRALFVFRKCMSGQGWPLS